MKYISIGVLIIIVAIFYFMNESNKESKERLKKAEIDQQQRLEQNKIDEAQAKKNFELERIQAEKTKALKVEQDKLSSQKQAEEFKAKQQTNIQSEIKEIEDKVREMAFDPPSTQFRNQKGNCGEVNGKNKYGGYTGYKKYIYSPQFNIVRMEGPGSDFYTAEMMQILWDKECG